MSWKWPHKKSNWINQLQKGQAAVLRKCIWKWFPLLFLHLFVFNSNEVTKALFFSLSDIGRSGVRSRVDVFAGRWPFKTSPCFHWHGDVRAVKDSSLSSLNSEGNGPGTESCVRRETFTPHRSEGKHSSLKWTRAAGRSPWIKTRNFWRWLRARESSTRRSTLTAAANGPSIAEQLLVDARPLLKKKKYAPAEPPQPRLLRQIPRLINQLRDTIRRLLLVCFFPPPALAFLPLKSAVQVPVPTCERDTQHYGREADSGARHGNTAGDSQRWIAVRGCEFAHW